MSTAIRRVTKAIGSAVLWLLALAGVLSAGLWVANLAGVVQPLVVVSGSMSPGIQVGDLLFATATPARELAVGEVATLPNPQTGTLVTHRVTSVAIEGDTVVLTMRGDANESDDPEPYVVAADARVWQPVVTIPGAGAFATAVLRPPVLIPGLIGLLALLSLSLIPGSGREGDGQTDAGAAGAGAHQEVTAR